MIALKDREKQMRLEAEESRKKLREHHEHLQEVRAKELELRQDFIELQKSVSKAGRLGLALGAAGVGSNKRQKALDALESKVNDSFFGDKYQVPWLRREGCKAFATWRIYTLKTKAAEENRANVAQAVHEALTRSRDAHEESVESLVARLKEERDAAVACSNAVSLLEGLEEVERRMKERDEERDTAREISRGQVDNLKNIITKEKEKAAQIDRARLELKHLLSEAEDATKVALAEGAERAEKASRSSAADYDYAAALLAARTARCKASISATKFDLERAPAELRAAHDAFDAIEDDHAAGESLLQYFVRKGVRSRCLDVADAVYANDYGESASELGAAEVAHEQKHWTGGEDYFVLRSGTLADAETRSENWTLP